MSATDPTNGTHHENTSRAEPPPARGGRDRHGRFAEGNSGGPGNPFARQVAALRVALLSAVTAQDVAAVAEELLRQAKEGNLAAAKLLLSYTLGKPAAAPVDPDTLDAQEWELYRRVPDPGPEAAAMIGRMPLETACEMARVVRPGMADAWKRMISDGIHDREREEQQEAERAARRRDKAERRRQEKAAAAPALPPTELVPPHLQDFLQHLAEITPPGARARLVNKLAAPDAPWRLVPPPSTNGTSPRRPGRGSEPRS